MLNWILIIMFYSTQGNGLVTTVRVSSEASCQKTAKAIKDSAFNRRFDFVCVEDSTVQP